ncbi:protein of unknown function [Pseudomonas sp. JV551A1]|uniref:Uncharacterized protein n=1 Tax=Pseudomonas inefficax TaxID=2078786 RepID=A0AAQ1STU5_9PSED|nr:protein of unknown function [Pseudomonas sp. JV551A1]SPO61378.1 protein of unknown function [Pseudomonas inefficax]
MDMLVSPIIDLDAWRQFWVIGLYALGVRGASHRTTAGFHLMTVRVSTCQSRNLGFIHEPP